MTTRRDIVVPASMQKTYETLHFAPAVKSAGFLFCSGVIGFGPGRELSPDPEIQFPLAFQSLETVLAEAGLTFDDVIELTSYHVGLQATLLTFVKVKDRFIPAPHPAWTAIGITELALPGALVEIKAVAKLRQ